MTVRCVWSELRWLGSLIGGRAWCFRDRTPLSTACSWRPKTPTSWRTTSTTWRWILGMRSVELCQEIGIEYVISWDPWSFLGTIPLPVHQIFQFTPTTLGTQDLLYRVDRSIFQHYRERGFVYGTRLCGNRRNGWVVGLEQRDMECRVNSILWRELEFIRDLIDLTDDGEGTNESGTQLFAGQS